AAGETAPFVKAIQAMIPELLNLNLSSALIDDLMIDELRPYFGTDFIPFLIRAFRKTLPDMPISDIESISTGLSDLFTAIAEATAVEPALTASLVSMTNISAITYTHYPELNYFWIKAMNPLIMKDPIPLNPKQTYQMIWSWGVKDLELRDESGTLVMKFKDGEPVALNSTYTYGIRTETSEGEKMDEYYLYFPADQSYELTMSGDEGEAAQFVLSYFNPATSEYIRHAGESFNYEKDTPYTYSVPSFSL
ncbi:MAG: hypothetical protein K6F32_07610, partial [Bacilli bacterium]|nr:hypothetical protein [Bacilli bacterium]